MKPTKPTTHILDLREARERYEKRCKDKNSCDYQEGVGDGMDIVLEMLRNEGKRCEKILNEYEQQTKAMAIAKKQAYEKGVADGKAEEKVNLQKKSYQQLKFYDSGYEQGQSDLKARLMSKEVINAIGYKIVHYNPKNFNCGLDIALQIIKEALAEATKEGGEK